MGVLCKLIGQVDQLDSQDSNGTIRIRVCLTYLMYLHEKLCF